MSIKKKKNKTYLLIEILYFFLFFFNKEKKQWKSEKGIEACDKKAWKFSIVCLRSNKSRDFFSRLKIQN